MARPIHETDPMGRERVLYWRERCGTCGDSMYYCVCPARTRDGGDLTRVVHQFSAADWSAIVDY